MDGKTDLSKRGYKKKVFFVSVDSEGSNYLEAEGKVIPLVCKGDFWIRFEPIDSGRK